MFLHILAPKVVSINFLECLEQNKCRKLQGKQVPVPLKKNVLQKKAEQPKLKENSTKRETNTRCLSDCLFCWGSSFHSFSSFWFGFLYILFSDSDWLSWKFGFRLIHLVLAVSQYLRWTRSSTWWWFCFSCIIPQALLLAWHSSRKK